MVGRSPRNPLPDSDRESQSCQKRDHLSPPRDANAQICGSSFLSPQTQIIFYEARLGLLTHLILSLHPRLSHARLLTPLPEPHRHEIPYHVVLRATGRDEILYLHVFRQTLETSETLGLSSLFWLLLDATERSIQTPAPANGGSARQRLAGRQSGGGPQGDTQRQKVYGATSTGRYGCAPGYRACP